MIWVVLNWPSPALRRKLKPRFDGFKAPLGGK